MTLRRIHVFESREHAFRDDDVTQENVILHAIKGADKGRVVISSSMGPEDEHVVAREIAHEEVVRPNDPDAFIYVAADELSDRVTDLMGHFTESLTDIGLEVSTGRVVDFRATKFLRDCPTKHTFPLIYPVNFLDGFISA